MPPGYIQLQVCESSDIPVVRGDLIVFKNGQVLPIDQLSLSILQTAACGNLFEGGVHLTRGNYQLQAAVKRNGGLFDQKIDALSPEISIVVKANLEKRFLFMLHTPSLWKLGDIQRRFVTSDSDLITLVCPPSMSTDEERAYYLEEEIAALELFSYCNREALSACLYPKFGNISWHRNCSRDDAELVLLHESKLLLPYSFYIFVQDENLLSLALIFEENYGRPSHRTFMSQFSRHRIYQRLRDAQELHPRLGSAARPTPQLDNYAAQRSACPLIRIPLAAIVPACGRCGDALVAGLPLLPYPRAAPALEGTEGTRPLRRAHAACYRGRARPDAARHASVLLSVRGRRQEEAVRVPDHGPHGG